MRSKSRRLAALGLLIPAVFFCATAAGTAETSGRRIVVPLDGTWSVADGTAPDAIPARFEHTVAVPRTGQPGPAPLARRRPVRDPRVSSIP